MFAPLRVVSLVYYFIIQIQLTNFISDILIHLVQVQVKSSFPFFHYATVPILHFHVLCFPLFRLTSFSTLLLWSIWKKKKNGQDLNLGPPVCCEITLSIRPRQPNLKYLNKDTSSKYNNNLLFYNFLQITGKLSFA